MPELQAAAENAYCFTSFTDPVCGSDPNPYYYVRCLCGLIKTRSIPQNHHIYLTNKYLTQKQATNLYSFELVRYRGDKTVALLHLDSGPSGVWSSVSSAPFNEIQFYETCSDTEVEFLLKCVENFVKMQHGAEIIIKSAPGNYPMRGPRNLDLIYQRKGFSVKQIFQNHYISVTQTAYDSVIKKMERRRLNKCQKAGFRTDIAGKSSISTVCRFIANSRIKRGYRLSISPEELENQAAALSDETIVVAVYNDQALIAATVAIRVTENVLYNFLPADSDDYRHFSPMLMLTAFLYQYCQQHGISQLDLGTSADHLGIEKPSLIRFKENIGGQRSHKITWHKVLDTQAVPLPVKDC